MEAQHACLLFCPPGKVAAQQVGIKRDREDFEFNQYKKCIFFKLDYWSSPLKHNFDLMHNEKVVGESPFGYFSDE